MTALPGCEDSLTPMATAGKWDDSFRYKVQLRFTEMQRTQREAQQAKDEFVAVADHLTVENAKRAVAEGPEAARSYAKFLRGVISMLDASDPDLRKVVLKLKGMLRMVAPSKRTGASKPPKRPRRKAS